MSEFHDVLFPMSIARGSSGGPERRTSIITLASGHEERNALWRHSRRRYSAGYGVRSLDDLHLIISFFEARQGSLHGFRFRDLMDWKSCLPSMEIAATDQTIGVGDNEVRNFQLTKTYSSGDESYQRPITKPVASSVLVEVAGSAKQQGRDWTLSERGEVVFTEAPTQGASITAGFIFDVPVRFANDFLSIDLAAFQAGTIPEIPLTEIRL